MLKLEFLSGSRKGETAFLHPVAEEIRPRPQIREDDVIKFSVTLNFKAKPRLVLHEIQMSATSERHIDDQWIYEWSPGFGEYRYNCFFQNYYGLATLDLLIDDEDLKPDNYDHKNPTLLDTTVVIEYQEIEILAKAQNAHRVDAMIGFLASQDPNLIASVFRVTRLRSGFQNDDGHTESQFLDRVERNVIQLEHLIGTIISYPLTKVVESTRLIVPTRQSVVDDKTVAWISDNLNELSETDNPYDSTLELDGIHYTSNKIQETFIDKKTNCYENQVVHGYAIQLKLAVKNILSSMRDTKMVNPKDTPVGYSSFFNQINKYSAIINRNKIDKCESLDARLATILARLRKYLPVVRHSLGIPCLTPKAKVNHSYREIFFKMIELLRFGRPDWSAKDELLSIKSISKLFEYYCLFLVRSKMEKTFGQSNVPLEGARSSDDLAKFQYYWKGLTIDLLYEPNYWAAGHVEAVDATEINSEGWSKSKVEKHKYSNILADNFAKGKKGTRHIYSRRTPDLVIRIENAERESKSIILDAKYTRNEKAFLDYLPDLTMKYIHGIHHKNTGLNNSVALMIINPTSDLKERTRHFHSDSYSIFGAHPVTPALLVSSLDFNNAENDESEFTRCIIKLLELTLNKLKTNDTINKLSVVA
ncbi:hypothetical protein [Pseudomonas atacamensis]|jgi:hypothetical protein|uniref:hypothetical protein n=1 Tax=Pseudomonas atacamensis TaxID=2565368 RepID=UPI00248148E5|nr:hypothetical protein [Pseudomonas atacamensis]WGT36386.1 hypothetical protein QG303_12730 [Pseudomonas atacamensis]